MSRPVPPPPPLDPGRTAPEFQPVGEGTRRDLLRWAFGASAAAGLAGCDFRPDEHALPYVEQPETVLPGRPMHYATAVLFDGVAQPVVAECHEGRPTKLEGNPRCPANGGATDAFTQAALLGLYDPARSDGPKRSGNPVGEAETDTMLQDLAGRLRSDGGLGFRLLTGPVSSPTLLRQIRGLCERLPGARWCLWDGLSGEEDPARLAFGRPFELRYALERAEVIVSLDHDVLGPGPLQTWHALGWGRRRAAFLAGRGACRLFVAEPSTSLTGIAATDRCAVRATRLPHLVAALGAALEGRTLQGLKDAERAWIAQAAAALKRHDGAALVTAGPSQPATVRAACLRMTAALNGVGRTVLVSDVSAGEGPRIAPRDLLGELYDGQVKTLVILGTDPILASPHALDVAGAIRRAGLSIHADLRRTEASEAAHWTIPLRHDLEDWSDGRMADGSVAVVQPVVRPLFGAMSRHSLLAVLAGDVERDPCTIVQETWRRRWQVESAASDLFAARWKQALLEGTADAAPVSVSVDANAPAPPPAEPTRAEDGIEAVVRPDPRVWDGRFAANPWLQELPDPLTKATWENSILVGHDLASEHGIATGDRVRVSAGAASLEGAAFVMPGMAERTIALTLGGGSKRSGEGAGYDPRALLPPGGLPVVKAITLTRVAAAGSRPVTQHVFDQQSFGHARVVSEPLSQAASATKAPASLYPEWPSPSPNWGMSIDLDLCIGCNACVVACTAENNVPTVGPEEVTAGRHMHWLRIDRYDGAPGSDAPSVFQPVPCMHCEKAPCEMGCPVNATTHSPDGLNQQVYNRCIGTRTCSSYCPYKVRRFNWFDFTADDPEPLRAQRNPNVTVRGRGVMEKCTYCVQRISVARIAAKLEDRAIADGEVQPACAQACPTRAITFGDVTDPTSAVSRLKAGPRHYALLEEVGTRPRTTYLARVAGGEADGGPTTDEQKP